MATSSKRVPMIILKEIGKGERVALAKLAIEHLEQSKRPLRIAIDAAIWNFQTQAGQGGKNPALRTLFYRLVKLLALPIDPVFVYDGTNKPLTKRGRTVSRYGTCISNEMSKKLIQAFRFPHHTAPGEAEAECAMLQSKGLVDAVMSQDVDAIMFGSTLTLRDWSKEASKHNSSPTHVSVLDLPRIKSLSGLDPKGMILVALMSGGDYDEAGVTGIGSTLACEIARAGFGSDLLELVRNADENGIKEWRERLQYELETNESGYFKMKRKLVKIPETFPNRKILGYYLNPAVTPEDQLLNLETKWREAWASEVDVPAMREYVRETFEWDFKPGAWKFVRVMAPALLTNRLLRRQQSGIYSADQILERRKHFISDGIPELRVTMIPADIVGIDLHAEKDSPEHLEALTADDKGQDIPEDEAPEVVPPSPSKKRKGPPWLPDAPEKVWVAETIVEVGARDHLQEWRRLQEEKANDPKKFAARKCEKTKDTNKPNGSGVMSAGTLLNYMVASKQSSQPAIARKARIAAPSRDQDSVGPTPGLSTPPKLAPRQKQLLSSPIMHDFFKISKSHHQLYVPDDPFREIPNTPTRKKPVDKPVELKSSPPVQPSKERRKKQPTGDLGLPHLQDVSASVTKQDTTRRKQKSHAEKELNPTEHSEYGSPTRTKRTIESFFAPYLAANKPEKTLDSNLTYFAEDGGRIPPELTTGLSTSFPVRHLRALPRDSLPGTWKEVGGEPSPRSGTHSSNARRLRVSIVDLTGD
ncbi:hypothetical protein PV08_11542 [Exophiala spinifera]|uniref:XPG-I domain-containing protein n=1 Tax=Exophiala spinifera TaxID=91928 RepID=A0A0D2AV49_9EURO|nr:uncharacterized protein PV08_11542 [Exophiala spinifera]KIW10578.1 hypothetical protein PV08_11542 [Exophiala spinifera]